MDADTTSRFTYEQSGVNRDSARDVVRSIGSIAKRTHGSQVIGGIGAFAGFFQMPSDMREPVLVSSTDGVGTKALIAQQLGVHSSIGIDLVAMCVDDVAVHGARPLFFLDYISIGRLNPSIVTQIVEGIARGCIEAGCALIGGETAEHPGSEPEDKYELAGFCVGVAERDSLISGDDVRSGDLIIGLRSSGLHANGYSLARKILLERCGMKLDAHIDELGCTLGEEMLRPTTIYSPGLLAVASAGLAKAMVHVTGGGIRENLRRVLPSGVGARIRTSLWEPPPIFRLIARSGDIEDEEMVATFNMGFGALVVVSQQDADAAQMILSRHGYETLQIGEAGPPPEIVV